MLYLFLSLDIMDYYNVLGVDKNATLEDIKKAYRKLASQHHPDKGGDKAKFQAIQEAYATLSDTEKRSQYDNPNQFSGAHFDFGGFAAEDIFAQMFGGAHFGQGFRRHPRNKNVNIVIQMTLEEIIKGKTVVGSIKLPSGKDQAIQLTIPPGVETGDAIKYEGLGDDAITNLPRGDLIAQIQEIPHHEFQRAGVNLITEKSISVFDALTGGKVKVTTVEGKTIEVTIPPGTAPGTTFSCVGYGVPSKQNRQRGSLYVKINFYVPQNLEDADRAILEEMKQKYAS